MESNRTQTQHQQAELPCVHPNDINLETETTPENRVQFSNVPLEDSGEKKKKQKVPRRILHFSDGILEEYSTDEEEEEPEEPPVDPKTLTWLPWFWYYMTLSAAKTLNVADFCGEKLAWFFGITSPKYQFAIDEYNRIKAEEQKEKEEEEREREAERRRMAEAMAGMEGALNTTEEPAPPLPTPETHPTPPATATCSTTQEKY